MNCADLFRAGVCEQLRKLRADISAVDLTGEDTILSRAIIVQDALPVYVDGSISHGVPGWLAPNPLICQKLRFSILYPFTLKQLYARGPRLLRTTFPSPHRALTQLFCGLQ